MSARTYAARKPLVIVGFMASGKSTVGLMLAQRLKVPFFDTDTLVEEEFGMTIADIFREKGERSFRKVERERLMGLLSDGFCVVAAGGGAFCDPATRATLAARARTIWLDPPIGLIQTRLAQCSKRPIAAASSAEQLRELWMARRGLYAEAHLHIESAHDDAGVIVEEIVAALATS